MTTKAITPEDFELKANENSEEILYVKVYPENLQDTSELERYRTMAGMQSFKTVKSFELKALNNEDIRKTIEKISCLFNDILKSDNSEETSHEINTIRSNDFSLAEIEISLGIEAGAKFFVTAKGNAGLTLKYKRNE